jgi:hypothetical protein
MHFITGTMSLNETVTCKSAFQYRSKLNRERTDEVSANYCSLLLTTSWPSFPVTLQEATIRDLTSRDFEAQRYTFNVSDLLICC